MAGPVWRLRWTTMTEALNFKFYLILMNLNLIYLLWPVATVWDTQYLLPSV